MLTRVIVTAPALLAFAPFGCAAYQRHLGNNGLQQTQQVGPQRSPQRSDTANASLSPKPYPKAWTL